jgi:hypothetical protein
MSVVLETDSAPAGAAETEDRIKYAAEMRRLFSPAGMVNADGSINQEFFRPKRVITVHDQRWGDAERDLLYEGIARFGIGRWNEIEAVLLPGWDHHALRGKTQKLIGCQNLSRYQGQQLTKAQVQAEQAKNKALGERTGCWKHGMLVDNDQGTLKAHFAAAAAAAAGTPEGGASAAGAEAAAAAVVAGEQQVQQQGNWHPADDPDTRQPSDQSQQQEQPQDQQQ